MFNDHFIGDKLHCVTVKKKQLQNDYVDWDKTMVFLYTLNHMKNRQTLKFCSPFCNLIYRWKENENTHIRHTTISCPFFSNTKLRRYNHKRLI